MASPDYYWNAINGINELLAQHASRSALGQHSMTEYLLLAGEKSCAVLGDPRRPLKRCAAISAGVVGSTGSSSSLRTARGSS